MEENVRGPFRPTKVVILSELTTRERELYYQLLVANNAKFYRDEQGRFVGNVRMLAPHVRKVDNPLIKRSEGSNYSLTFQDRLTKLMNEGFIEVNIIATERMEYNSYPRFTALIANNGDSVKPRQRQFTWVMKIVEDLYDHRFSHEKNDIEREDESPNFDLMLLVFPVFVVRRIGTNVGLKAIVDQTCWDLLYTVNLYRKENLEIEMFGRFLQEFYDHDDLVFFLYVRSVIAKVLHISFKSRWQKKFDGVTGSPKALWISYREAAHVARIVFGSDNEGMYRDFMRLITPQMVGEKTPNGGDSRKIDITEYLHLAVVGYHQSQSQQQDQEGRMLVPIPGQVVPVAPAPMPTGVSYADKQQQGAAGAPPTQQRTQYGYDASAPQGEYSNFDFAADEQEYAQYGGGEQDYQQQQYSQDPYQRNHAGSGSYEDDPYAAAELAEGVDLLSLASSPIGRLVPGGAAAEQRGSAGPNSSHLVPGEEDIPFDRSMRYTEVETPMQAQQQAGYEMYGDEEGEAGQYEGEGQGGEMNAFEALQMEREAEFLGALIDPLQLLPEEYAQYATNDLGDRLHQTVQIYLSDKSLPDLDALEAHLREFLSLAELRADMESFRDEIIEYYLQDDQMVEAGGQRENKEGQEQES